MALAGCGHELRPGVQFCTVCGRSVADDSSVVPDLQTPVTLGSPTTTDGPGLRPFDDPVASPQRAQPDVYAPTVTSRANQAPPPQPGPDQAPPPQPGSYRAPPAEPGSRRARPAGPRSHQTGPRRSRKPLLFGLIAVLVAGALAVIWLVVQPFHNSPLATQTSSPATVRPSSASASASTSPSSSISAQEQAAEGLSGLLAQSVQDRSSIVTAVSDVNQCGPNLNQDQQTFQNAGASRQNLLTQLANLPGRSALPPNMLAALTSAWQNSIKADQHFAQWAQDEVSHGCTQNDLSDPNAQAAVGPDDQATIDKQKFVSLWNPMATRYGLPPYQTNQL